MEMTYFLMFIMGTLTGMLGMYCADTYHIKEVTMENAKLHVTINDIKRRLVR